MYRKIGTLKERTRALDFLRTVCRKDGDYSQYDAGWSDKKVSRHIRTLSTRVIADLRREYIGKSRAHLDRWNAGLGGKMAAARQAAAAPEARTPAIVAAAATEARLRRIETQLDLIMSSFGIPNGGRHDDTNRH